jgi:hypothetical protein
MGQVLACCTVAEREANYDAIYPPQEIEQPWKEKIETNEGKVVLAVDPNFTDSDDSTDVLAVDPNFTDSEDSFTDSEEFCPYYYEHEGIKRPCDSINIHRHFC